MNKILLVCILSVVIHFAFVSGTYHVVHRPILIPIHRYWNGVNYFLTNNPAEVFTLDAVRNFRLGYTYQGVAFYVFKHREFNTIPFYRYWNGFDFFYTTNPNEVHRNAVGFRNVRSKVILGYVHRHRNFVNAVPLYRYYNGQRYFYTINGNEIGTVVPARVGRWNYAMESVHCYVFPTFQTAPLVLVQPQGQQTQTVTATATASSLASASASVSSASASSLASASASVSQNQAGSSSTSAPSSQSNSSSATSASP